MFSNLNGDAVTAASDKIKLEEQYAEELDAVREASRFKLFSENAEKYDEKLIELAYRCQTQRQQTTTDNVAYYEARQSFIEIFKSGNLRLGEAMIHAVENSENITEGTLRDMIDSFQLPSELSNQLSLGASNWNNSESKTQSEPVRYNGVVDELKQSGIGYNVHFKGQCKVRWKIIKLLGTAVATVKAFGCSLIKFYNNKITSIMTGLPMKKQG